jgi:macrophage erythroblast attacher
VPYENYRKVFRTTQKNVERELGAVQSAAADLVKKASTTNREETLKTLQTMTVRVETLKRKV